MQDFSNQIVEQLDHIKNTQDFCKDWKAIWRGIAIAAQSVLNIFYPPGAKVLGFLITITDAFCART